MEREPKSEIQLYDFQKEGIEFLSGRKHAFLADEMGLGKTVQAIRAADKVGAGRILIICPAIARINWFRELEKFALTRRTYEVVEERKEKWDYTKSVVASFQGATYVRDSGPFDVVIIDEAHFLKSVDAQRAKNIIGRSGIVHKSKYVWPMSGTPAPNNASELWVWLYVFGKTALSFDAFTRRYCETFKGPYGLQIRGNSTQHLPELKTILSTFLLRREKRNVMKQLPPITYGQVVVPPSPVKLDEQSSFIEYALDPVARDELFRQMEIQKAMIDGTVNHSFLTDAQKIEAIKAMASSVSTLRRYNGLEKVDSVAAIIDEELSSGAYQKIVLFAIHRDVIEGLRAKLRKHKPTTLYGGFDMEKQQRHIDKFQKNPHCKVIIANILTAGTAIDLTASHQLAFVEQDWVPGNNAQAVMRCHRIGQKFPVTVRFFALENSLDERVSAVLRRKTKDLTQIFDESMLTESNHDGQTSSSEFEKIPTLEDLLS